MAVHLPQIATESPMIHRHSHMSRPREQDTLYLADGTLDIKGTGWPWLSLLSESLKSLYIHHSAYSI